MNYEVGRAVVGEPFDPRRQQLVKPRFADAHRGVRPDELDFPFAQGRKRLVGGEGLRRETCARGVLSGQFECAFVDVHCPHVRARGFLAQGERQRAPSASQVDREISRPEVRFGRLVQQHGSSLVYMVGGEDAARRRDRVLAPPKADEPLDGRFVGRRRLGKIMLVCHATSLASEAASQASGPDA